MGEYLGNGLGGRVSSKGGGEEAVMTPEEINEQWLKDSMEEVDAMKGEPEGFHSCEDYFIWMLIRRIAEGQVPDPQATCARVRAWYDPNAERWYA